MATQARRRRKTTTSKSKTTTPKPPANDYDDLPYNMVLHGLPGVGKTSFAANSPSPHFIIGKNERGVMKLKKRRLIDTSIPVDTVTDWQELIGKVNELADASMPHKTVVLDSATVFEKMCFQYMCDKDYGGQFTDFYLYSKGPKQAANREWTELLDALTDLADAGKNLIFIAHSAAINFQNPEGPDYTRWVPRLDTKTWEITNAWAEYVLFANFHVNVEKVGLRDKADTTSGSRWLNLQWNPAYDAKCLSECDPSIEMGSSGKEAYANFVKEVGA